MKRITYLIVLLSLLFQVNTKAQWNLIWSDDFNGTVLDSSKWLYATGPNPHNDEQQYYTDLKENVRVENGLLTLEVLQKEFGGKNYTSGRLNSKETWCYGKMEIKARLTNGTGLWPAIWMYPENEIYGHWPRSGEIDIMEYWSWDSVGIYGNAHCEKFNHMKHAERQGRFSNPTPSTEFHVYGLEWYKDQMSWFVDGVKFLTIYNGETIEGYPFDHPFKFILNVAVESVGPGNENTWKKRSMEIDYVKVYEGAKVGPEFKPHEIPGEIKADEFYSFKGAKKEPNRITPQTHLLLHNTDFMNYRIQVNKSGQYELLVQVNKADSAGKLEIIQNNIKMDEIVIPVSNKEMQKVRTKLHLEKGLQTIKLVSIGEFNLYDLEFEYTKE